MKIGEMMTRDVQYVKPASLIKDAAKMMKSLDTGVLPVCEGRRLVGILTDRDIVVRAVAEGADINMMKVGDIMSFNVESCYEDDSFEAVVLKMEKKMVRRMPVINRSGELCGIVSLGDLILRGNRKEACGVLKKVSEHVHVR